MFRIIAESKNKGESHILLEGTDKIKSVTSELIIVSAGSIILKISGSGLKIERLGEGYLQISGRLQNISCEEIKDEHI